MRKRETVTPKPYVDEVRYCDWCGRRGGEFYTPYDLHGEEYPLENSLDLHDECRAEFVHEYGPRIWAVMDEVLVEVKKRHAE